MSEDHAISGKQVYDSSTHINILLYAQTNEVISGWVIISDSERTIAQWVIYTCLCLAISVFGAGANIINIICFVKQGFKDSVNVSLLGLAISDLGCLVPLIWGNICLTPAFINVDPPFDPDEFQYLTSTWPHIAFSRVSSWITALITMERCLCVTAPLQVKNIVTTKRMTIIIVCVFIICIAGVSSVYAVNGFGMKFYPSRNKSVLGLVFRENREVVDNIAFVFNNVLLSFSCFIIIIFCTAVLVIKLNMSIQWRVKSSARQIDNVSDRNKKVAKMVVMISTLFIICFIPMAVFFIALILQPDLRVNGKHRNVSFVSVGICLVMESVNSSMNIFIYLHMSTKFRVTFLQLFYNK